jgi:hypothetical protein
VSAETIAIGGENQLFLLSARIRTKARLTLQINKK